MSVSTAGRSAIVLSIMGILIAAAIFVTARADTDEIRRLIRVSDSLSNICEFSGALTTAERLVERVEADSMIHDSIRAKAHEILGERLLEWGYYDRCQKHLDQSLSILENTSDDVTEAKFRVRLLHAKLQLTLERNNEARKWLAPLLDSAGTGDSLPISLLSRGQYLRARLEKNESDYKEAERWYRLAIETESRYPELSNMRRARYLTGLARLCLILGRSQEGDSLLTEACHTIQTEVNTCHPDFINWMVSKALSHKISGEFAAADSLNSCAIAAVESGFGPGHPDLVDLLNYQSTLYWAMGRYEENERIARRALETARLVCGQTSPGAAAALNNLGSIYYVLGRYEDAVDHFLQAVEIYETLPEDHRQYMVRLVNNLGAAYRRLGRLEESEKMYIRSLLLRREIYGPDHADVAKALNNLSKVYADQGKTEEALTTLLEAASIWKRALGEDHPDVAIALKNLGDLQCKRGHYDEALDPYRQSYKIWFEAYGPGHSNLGYSLEGLARAFAALGRIDSSYVYYEELLQQQYRFVDYAFSFSSETQKLQCLKEYPLIDHSLLSLAVETGDPRLERMAFEMLLKGKAVVIDVMSSDSRTAFCSIDKGINRLLARHREVCDQIAELALASSSGRPANWLPDSLRALYRLQDEAEADLSRQCSAFGDALASRRFQIEDVAGRLDDGETLWEYVRYRPYVFDSVESPEGGNAEERYLVFVLNRSGEVEMFDLGECKRIDSLIYETKHSIEDGAKYVFSPLGAELESQLAETTGRLFDLLIRKPLEYSKPASKMYVSPDGAMNLIPLEILPVSSGRYLIEELSVCYLTTGRDLLTPAKTSGRGGRVAIFADPDFDADIGCEDKNDNGLFSGGHREKSQSGPLDSPCIPETFPRLPNTRMEGDAVASLLQSADAAYKVTAYYDSLAGKVSLMGMKQPPLILHLATHGFFCHAADEESRPARDLSLLHSGLALAGANRHTAETEPPTDGSDSRNGIVTALELSGLNLTETELVVLSACETGSGNPMAGEGVFGLRRVFQLAGARSILLSLWRIPDRETIELVETFYRGWLSGQGKAEALRKAALAGLNRARHELGSGHPYTWGAFILTGRPE